MNGYLMDTNHVSKLSTKDSKVWAKIQDLPADTPVFSNAITLGEIAAGHAMVETTNQNRRNDVVAFINQHFVPHSLSVTHSTGHYYAKIMGRLWRTYPPAKPGIRTEVHLSSLGVDVNDIWIVASAWEHGLIFLTADQMQSIRSVLTNNELAWDNWC